MPLTPIPSGFGIATIKYQRVDSGQVEVSTFGYQADNTESPSAEAQEISGLWMAQFTAGTSLAAYRHIGVHVLRNFGGVYASGDYITSIAGTVSAAPVPPAVCVCVTKQTAQAGRKHRGRMYLPGFALPAANVDDNGIIDNATLSGIQGRLDAFLTAAGADTPPYLLHKDLSAPDLIFKLLARTSVRTQRRRQVLA